MPATLICRCARVALWVALLCWLALVCLLWVVTPSDNNMIQQCVHGIWAAALSVIGYAACRALTEVVSIVEASLKEYQS